MTDDGTRNLTDEDIKALVVALQDAGHSPCRFEKVDPELMIKAVEFYDHYNRILADSKNVVGKTLLVLIVTGAVTVFGWGIVTLLKVKQVTLGE